MSEPQPKRIKSTNKRRHFRAGRTFIAAFITLVFVTSSWQLYQLKINVNQKMAQLSKEKQDLLQEKSGLEKEIVQLNTPSYIEQLAREQLGLVKKGEIMISPKKQ